MNSLEYLNKIEELIKLSINPNDLEKNFPEYSRELAVMCDFMKSNGREDGKLINYKKIFPKFEDLKNIEIRYIFKNEPMDFSDLTKPAKVLLFDAEGQHFAAAYIEGNDVYILDSLPGHTQWFVVSPMQVHNLPVPLQNSNNCAINTAINLGNIDNLINIYKNSKIEDTEVVELTQIYKNIAIYTAMKNVLSGQKEDTFSEEALETLQAKLMSVAVSINPYSEVPSKIVDNLKNGSKLKECVSYLNSLIEESTKNYNEILDSCKLRCEQTLTTKEFESNSQKTDSQLRQEVVSTSKKPKTIALAHSELSEDVEIFKTVQSEISLYDSEVLDKISLKTIEDKKELVDKISEIAEDHKNFATDILANIDMAIIVNSKHQDKEMARKNAIKEAKEMLGIS